MKTSLQELPSLGFCIQWTTTWSRYNRINLLISSWRRKFQIKGKPAQNSTTSTYVLMYGKIISLLLKKFDEGKGCFVLSEVFYCNTVAKQFHTHMDIYCNTVAKRFSDIWSYTVTLWRNNFHRWVCSVCVNWHATKLLMISIFLMTILIIKIQQDRPSYIKFKKKISNKGGTCSKFNISKLNLINMYDDHHGTK
jgi:hypothetical protein